MLERINTEGCSESGLGLVPLCSQKAYGTIEAMKIAAEKKWLLTAGGVIGLVGALLAVSGNPANMGICVACFIRDTAGALKLHAAPAVQYVRPEPIAILLGSFIISLARKEFSPRAGSSPVLRFFIGAMVMIGALVFLGCPLRMVLRIAGGDLNGVVGLLGFATGIGAGCIFLNRGFTLGRAHKTNKADGAALPVAALVLLLVSIAVPALFASSTSGPGSMRAPLLLALVSALAVGMIAQRARLCMAGGIRDAILLHDFNLLEGFAAIFAAALVVNIVTGRFHLGFEGQPIAHAKHLWNFLGLFVVGLGSSMLGGCPLRQLIMAGEGSGDSAASILGMLVGAGVSHSFGLAGAANDGPGLYGKIAVIACIVILLAICIARTEKE